VTTPHNVFRVSTPHKCWQCGQAVEGSLFCPACNSLQPPPADYYDLLGLERRLKLSADDLQKRFYELSRQLHPDRFMRKSETERQYSLDASSILNDAYRALKDPVKRAQYLLAQEGFDVGEQRSKDVPPELLEEVFELNMALEEMRSGDDSARPQLEAAEKTFTNMLADVDQQIELLFEKYDQASNREALGEIRGVLNRRKYILNLVDEVHKTLSPAAHAPQPTI
jgi:molecular chaperone HscB